MCHLDERIHENIKLFMPAGPAFLSPFSFDKETEQDIISFLWIFLCGFVNFKKTEKKN